MKTFRLISDVSFDAKNLEDACIKLSKHFRRVAIGGKSEIFTEGKMMLDLDIEEEEDNICWECCAHD